MGKGRMGTVLELGSERDLGIGHMALLHGLHPSETDRQDFQKNPVPSADLLILLPSDVLVGSQLSADSAGQRTCILIKIICL